MNLQIRDVVLRSPVTAGPESSIEEAEQQLISANATDVYVVDDHARLLGVVPDYEFLKHRLRDGSSRDALSTLMSPVGVSLQMACCLESAALLLRENIRASIPVLEGGRLIGQLCRGNLLRILAESAGSEACHADTLPESGSAPAPHFVRVAQGGQVLTFAASE